MRSATRIILPWCLAFTPALALTMVLSGCGQDNTTTQAPESPQLKASNNAMEDFMKSKKGAKK